MPCTSRLPKTVRPFVLAAALAAIAGGALAAPAPRPQPAVGNIVDARGDAQIALIEAPDWRIAEIAQDLLTGDDLRTGPLGALALLFVDRTQIRVHRNTQLKVTAVASVAGQTETFLELAKGRLWSRATRGGESVRVRTPAATAAIRGTDWALEVAEDGTTRLVVLEGEVSLENEFGAVTVRAGEAALARIGEAPTKLFLINPAERPQLLLYGDIRGALRDIGTRVVPPADRAALQAAVDAVPEAQRSGVQWIDAAGLALARRDWDAAEAARQRAADAGAPPAQLGLIDGALASHRQDFAAAAEALRTAAPGLDPRQRRIALAGAYLALIVDRQMAAAQAVRAELETLPDGPELSLIDSAVEVFTGDVETARTMLQPLRERFPDDPDVLQLYGQILLLQDRRDELRELAEGTAARRPDLAVAWYLLGAYRANIEGRYEDAVAAFRRGLEIDPTDTDLLNELGLALYQLDERRDAEAALRQALAIDAYDTPPRANLSILLLDENRYDEATPEIDRLRRSDPSLSSGYLAEGRLAFARGDVDRALELFLEAVTIDPASADATVATAIGFAAREDFTAAEDAVDDAMRLDPNDATAPRVGAVIARDTFQADRSIELAREAMVRIDRTGDQGNAGLAASRGGQVSLGAAFTFLGLNDWGRLYGDMLFDPLDSSSLLFRGATAAEADVRLSSSIQGFVLDPLSVADRLRYTDLIRRPFLDTEVGAQVGSEGGAGIYGASFDVETLQLGSKPFALSVIGSANRNNGDGPNRDSDDWTVTALAGLEATPFDRFLLTASGAHGSLGLPGTADDYDPDDESKGDQASVSLGYSHTVSARNAVLARAFYEWQQSEVTNGRPFGSTLDAEVYSLLRAAGIDTYEQLQAQGLFNVTGTFCDQGAGFSPWLAYGAFAPLCGGTALPGVDLDHLDTSTLDRLKTDEQRYGGQVRHTFDAGPVTVSYGTELLGRQQDVSIRQLVFSEQSTGVVYDPLDPDAGSFFPFGDAVPDTQHEDVDVWLLSGHLDTLWRPTRALTLQAGLFPYQNWTEGDAASPQLGPRAGIGWSPVEGHWLRAIYRDEPTGPLTASLAPATTLGLAATTTYLSDNGRSRSFIGRWDAEWSRFLLSTVELRRQLLHDVSIDIPSTLSSYASDNATLDTLTVGANSWITHGIGLFAQAAFTESDASSGGDVPLVPKQAFTAGGTWIHPSSLQVTLSTNLAWNRESDVTGGGDLKDFASVDLNVGYEPFRKHLALQFSLLNILDRDNELAAGIPAPSRTALVGAKVRF
ncbi:MAG: FecR domain-containing protein [Geminicoccaceae bacterium]